MLRKFLTGLAAVIVISGAALGANLTLLSGPQDPSQLLATLNSLIRTINTSVNGRLYANTTAAGNSTTIENTMMSYSLPAGQLAAVGDSVRVVCWGTSTGNSTLKTAKLYFGASVIATTAANPTPVSQKWFLDMLVTRSGAATQNVLGRGTVDTTAVNVYTNSGTDNLAAAVTIKCTGTAPSNRQDITAQQMFVEQIK